MICWEHIQDILIKTQSARISVNVPEPSSLFGLAVLGTLGAVSTVKRKLKLSKSSEEDTTKVG